MKLILYELREVGYVKLDPYEYEYDGRLDAVANYLRTKPEITEYVAVDGPNGENAHSEVALTGKEYLQMLGSRLKDRRLHGWEIVNE
jgi:hypothetical protein